METSRLFEFGFLFRGIDRITGVLKSVERHIEAVNEAAKKGAGLREFTENFGLVRAGAIAAGGALAAGVYSLAEPAIQMHDTMAHVQEAMGDGVDTAKNLAEVQEKAEELSSKGVISAKALADAYYNARMNGA